MGTMEQMESRQPIPLLDTKLSIPRPRAGLVHRSRLTERLNQECHLILVVASAGWGKSSVVCDWCAQQADNSVAWLSIDTGDNDPTRFLLYLAAACSKVRPGLGDTTRSLLQSPQPASVESALTILLNEINTLDRALTIVLDDYHLIESQAIHDAITFLLDHQPPTLRLIIASRVDPPLPLSRLRVRGQLRELRASDLRFTQEEAALFLNRSMGLKLDAVAVERLEARTEGWIAGLQLAALSLEGRTDPTAFLDSFTGSNRYIVDYLFDEVLANQSEVVQNFLMETALLNRLCGPLCEAVTGQTHGQGLLEQLEAGNLFLIPLDEERKWYRYHHLFEDVLQARLALQGKERISELHRRAAVWYDSEGIAEEAVHHALAGNHLELAAAYVEAYSDAIWIRGGQRTIEQWLKAFPEEQKQAHPVLSILQATLHLYDLRLDAALEVLDNCRFEPQVDNARAQNLRGRMAAIRSDVTRVQGNFELSLTQAQEALACLSREDYLWRGIVLFNLGVLLFEKDAPADAVLPLTEAIEESITSNNPHSHLQASMALGQVREAQGALKEAERLYRSALDFAEERKFHHTGETAFIYAGLGRCSYHVNDLTAAESSLNEGLKRKHPAYSLSCYLELARLKQAQGDRNGIAALLPQMDSIMRHASLPWLASVVTAMKIHVQILDGEATAAWVQAYEARAPGERAQRVPMLGMREFEAVTWGRARLAEGLIGPVRERMESMLAALTERGLHGSTLEIRALLATIYQRERQIEQAVMVLEPALLLAEKEGHIRVFLDAGTLLIPVLRQAAAQGIAPEHIAKLLAGFRAEGPLQADRAEHEALSEREVEVLRLVAAGLSNPQIAEHLFLSVGTVKRHVYNIFHKLDVTGRVEAITRARERQLL